MGCAGCDGPFDTFRRLGIFDSFLAEIELPSEEMAIVVN